MAYWLLRLVFLAVFLHGASAACSGSTCGECISSDPNCSWCAHKNFTAPRCQTYSSLTDAGCDKESIQNPVSTTTKPEDERVQDSSQNTRAIQVQPQRVRITTRPRKKETFTMTFRAADNFPVDLYFLFDNSLSMNTHIQSLAKLTSDIGRSIGDISSNYRMAYGVFQDKVILPYTDTTPSRLKNPCIQLARECSSPFEFKHLLSMTQNIAKFENAVNTTGLTGNIDRPEGSTDAILQAVTCTQLIGWRQGSRKLLIFASDGRFHIAGDGKLAGIILPNDGHCHLNNLGHYAKELQQDYPSVSQLTDIVERHEVHIIFAVTEQQQELFSKLSQRIPQSTVELLANGGGGNQDIRQIIEKKYREMVSEVEILHSHVEGVDVKIKAKSPTCERQDTNVCKGIEIGRSVEFDVEVVVTSCPASGNAVRTLEIYPESLSQDKLILEIETQCDCSCALDQSTWEVNSPLCSDGNGTLKCGQCDCHADRFGQTCECDASDTAIVSSGCIMPGENSTNLECSGAGSCECGVCLCDEGFSGPYCECNDRSCGTFQRELCGGIRGRCQCGECVCQSDYLGPTCGCPASNATCLSDDGKLCSDQGSCECGQCQCDEGYVGLYCETCILCGDSVCDIPEYRTCAECLLLTEDESEASKRMEDLDCSLSCPDMTLVDKLTEEELEKPGVCLTRLGDGCLLSFRISSNDSNVTIQVVNKKQCPTPVNVTPVVVGVVVGVVLLGLALLLLWKLVTYVIDKREYSKFQEDLSKGRWAQNDNPMYKGATTTYHNPMLDPSDVQ